MLSRSNGGGGESLPFFPVLTWVQALCLVVVVGIAIAVRYGRNLDFLSFVAGAIGSSANSGHPPSELAFNPSSNALAKHDGSWWGFVREFVPGGEEGGVKRELGG